MDKKNQGRDNNNEDKQEGIDKADNKFVQTIFLSRQKGIYHQVEGPRDLDKYKSSE